MNPNPAPQNYNNRALINGDGEYTEYPQDFLRPFKKQVRSLTDPFGYLGPILYTSNTFINKGKSKDNNNLLMGNHMSKTHVFENARRLILAESPGGLPNDIDDDQIQQTAEAYYFDHVGPDRTQNLLIHENKHNLGAEDSD